MRVPLPGLARLIECGHRLTEKKATIKHGLWKSWLADNAAAWAGVASIALLKREALAVWIGAGTSGAIHTDLSITQVAICANTAGPWGAHPSPAGSQLRSAGTSRGAYRDAARRRHHTRTKPIGARSSAIMPVRPNPSGDKTRPPAPP
jgi:hypothetical protein